MSDEGQIGTALVLALVFAPAIAASVGTYGSATVWKFLSTLCCALALVGVFLFVIPGVLLWIGAWVFAGIARREASRDRSERTTIAELKRQNELLRAAQAGNVPAPEPFKFGR